MSPTPRSSISTRFSTGNKPRCESARETAGPARTCRFRYRASRLSARPGSLNQAAGQPRRPQPDSPETLPVKQPGTLQPNNPESSAKQPGTLNRTTRGALSQTVRNASTEQPGGALSQTARPPAEQSRTRQPNSPGPSQSNSSGAGITGDSAAGWRLWSSRLRRSARSTV